MASPKYRSKFEGNVAKALSRAKVKFRYEYESLIWFEPAENWTRCTKCGSVGDAIQTQRRYSPDFYLPATDHYLETKGKWTAKDRRKMVEVTKKYPNITMVFMRDNKIHKQSKTKYSDFCIKNDIDYFIFDGKIPKKYLRKNK